MGTRPSCAHGDRQAPSDGAAQGTVLSYLHPDRAPDDPAARKRLEATFQEFSSLKFVEGD